MNWYILDGHHPVLADSDAYYRQWKANGGPFVVALTECEGVCVSTVFLGLDHNMLPGGPPMLFETMVFADGVDAIDKHQERYPTWEDAEAGHRAVVELVGYELRQLSKSRTPAADPKEGA